MKSKLRVNKIYVKKSPLHGFGVFAGKNFRKGEILEQCYTLITRGGDRKLEDYYFDADGKYAILTGFGVIYNHADEPNADYKINAKTCVATIKAEKPIKKGEEIFVSYGTAWFKSRKLKPIHHSDIAAAKKKKRRKVQKKKLRKKRRGK